MVTETFGSMELNEYKILEDLSLNRGWNTELKAPMFNVNTQTFLKCHDSNINFIELRVKIFLAIFTLNLS